MAMAKDVPLSTPTGQLSATNQGGDLRQASPALCSTSQRVGVRCGGGYLNGSTEALLIEEMCPVSTVNGTLFAPETPEL